MKRGPVVIAVMVMFLLTCFCVGSVQGELWLRLSFNYKIEGAMYDTYLNDGGSSSAYFGRAYNTTNPDRVGMSFNRIVNIPGDVDSYIDIRSNTVDALPPDLSANGMTIAYWVNYDMTAETQNQSYMTLLTTHTNNGFSNLQQHLKYPCNPGGCSGPYTQRWFCNSMAGKVTVNNSQWYHLVYTLDSGYNSSNPGQQTAKYYLNGQLMATTANISVAIGQSVPTRFGLTDRNGFTEQFAGNLDQLDIFDNKLTGAEVTALYQEGPQLNVPPVDCPEAVTKNNGLYKLRFDLNSDCQINLIDFAMFNQVWLNCIDPDVEACDKPWL